MADSDATCQQKDPFLSIWEIGKRGKAERNSVRCLANGQSDLYRSGRDSLILAVAANLPLRLPWARMMRQHSQPANIASDPQIPPPTMMGETWPRSARPRSGRPCYQQWTCQTRQMKSNRRKVTSVNLLRLASPNRFPPGPPTAIHGIPRRVAEFRDSTSSPLEPSNRCKYYCVKS